MAFLKLQEDRCINTDQVADLNYSPAGPVQIVSPGSEAAPMVTAHLTVGLSSGETISVDGTDADALWEAFQSSLQQSPPQPDWFLQMLVEMANNNIVSLDVTLQVSGFLVSGQLVGGGDYFDGMGEDFARAFPSEAERMKSTFADMRDQHYPKGTDAPTPGAVFIHLKNARFFNTAGNPIPGNGGVWWRGRLAEVSGFVLGGLSPARA